MNIRQAKKIMGKNFIGLKELRKIASRLGITDPAKTKQKLPKINFNARDLRKLRNNHLLILGISKDKNGENLTINKMRSRYGFNPQKSEPCFYNQDWYEKEKFADKIHLKFQWYLIGKKVIRQTRGKDPQNIKKILAHDQDFPSAILITFVFFAYYFLTNGEILWKHDFIWCSDKDRNGDRIYVGHYLDPRKINKNGFNIHRHLSIRSCYGAIPQIIW